MSCCPLDRLRWCSRRSLRSGLRFSPLAVAGPSGVGVSPAALASASLAFFASRFFLFFSAAFDKFSSPSAAPDAGPLAEAAPGGRLSIVSAPGTCLRGLPNPFEPTSEVPLLTMCAAPPSSSRLKCNGVDVPRAPGGRYAPAGFEGVFTVLRYASADAWGVGTGCNWSPGEKLSKA